MAANLARGVVQGSFSYGDTLSMADCYLLPQVYNAQRYAVDLGSAPARRRRRPRHRRDRRRASRRPRSASRRDAGRALKLDAPREPRRRVRCGPGAHARADGPRAGDPHLGRTAAAEPDRPSPDADVERASVAPAIDDRHPGRCAAHAEPRAAASGSPRRGGGQRRLVDLPGAGAGGAQVHARGDRGAREYHDALARDPPLHPVPAGRHARRRRQGSRAHPLPPPRNGVLPRGEPVSPPRLAPRERDPRRHGRRAEHDRPRQRLARPRDRREPRRNDAADHGVRGVRRLGDEPRRHRDHARRRVRRRRQPARPPRARSPTPPSWGRRGRSRRSFSTTTPRTSSGTRTSSSTPRPRGTRPTTPSCSTTASAGASARGTISDSRRRSSSTTGSRGSTRPCRMRRAITTGPTSSRSTSRSPRGARSSPP